jgi:hypothetical protein
MDICYLEKDMKNYDYFQRYARSTGTQKEFFQIDNQIQAEEIHIHLKRHGYTCGDCGEVVEWVNKNGKTFRDFLNTNKIIYLVFKSSGHAMEKITLTEFFEKEEEINKKNKDCLEAILKGGKN